MLSIEPLIKYATDWNSINATLRNEIASKKAPIVEHEPYCYYSEYNHKHEFVFHSHIVERYNKLIFRSQFSNEIQFHYEPDIETSQNLLEKVVAQSVKRSDLNQKFRKPAINPRLTFADVENHICEIFTTDVVSKVLLPEEDLRSHLDRMKQYVTDENFTIFHDAYSEPLLVLRLEEVRENLVVTLAISPIDFEMKLGIRPVERYDYENPLTRFYVHHFTSIKEMEKRFPKYYRSKHMIGLFEDLGFEKSPDNSKNANSFLIKFNDGDIFSESRQQKSGLAQMKFTEALLAHLNVFCGSDLNGKWGTESDVVFLTNESSSSKFRYYEMLRLYFTPYADIRLLANLITSKDDIEDLATLFTRATPYAGDVPNMDRYFYHPFVYEIGK